MFLDASAAVAILTNEPVAERLSRELENAGRPVLYSSLVVYETVVSIAKKVTVFRLGDHHPTPPDIFDAVERQVLAFLAEVGAVEMPLDMGLHKFALDAARRFFSRVTISFTRISISLETTGLSAFFRNHSKSLV